MKSAANWFLLLGSVVVALALSEALTRYVAGGRLDTDHLLKLWKENDISLLIQRDPNPKIEYRLKKNLDVVFKGKRVRTNDRTLRVSAEPSEPGEDPSDTYRIAALGDSTSFGWGVDYDEIYVSLFQKALSEQSACRLDNYSVPGYNSVQELEVFTKAILSATAPDLLIVQHDNNDWEPTGREYLPPDYGDNLLHSQALKLLYRVVEQRKIAGRWGLTDPRNVFLGPYLAEGTLYDNHKRALLSLVQTAVTRGIPTIVILLDFVSPRNPDYEDSREYQMLHKFLARDLERVGALVLDLYPLVQTEMEKRRWDDLSPWWHSKGENADRHPNAAGHLFLAEKLIAFAGGTVRTTKNTATLPTPVEVSH